MRLLAYHVRRPTLPHAYLVHYLHSLLHWISKGIAQPSFGDLNNMTPSGGGLGGNNNASAIALARLPGLAWSMLADSYQTSMCLDFAPEHIAAAVLHLALRIAGVEVPGNRHSEMAWWQVLLDDLFLVFQFLFKIAIFLTKNLFGLFFYFCNYNDSIV